MHRVHANFTAPNRQYIYIYTLCFGLSVIYTLELILRIKTALTLEWMVVLFLPLEDKNTQSHNKNMNCKDSIQYG